MPRTTRTYAPGVAFHVVAVTQGRERWFVGEVADRIADDIDIASNAAGHRVLARTVMPNHFHIILKHGTEPLAWMMQRVMQRAAMMVTLKHGHEGHVFKSRYWAEPIPSPVYLRRAIIYTHENPVKAGLCQDSSDYPWSSHNQYADLATAGVSTDSSFVDGLMVFADDKIDVSSAFVNYSRFVEFCRERRRLQTPGDWLLPGTLWFDHAPCAPAGDNYFADTYTHFNGDACKPRRYINVQATAEQLLRRINPAVTLDDIRFSGPKSMMADTRIQLVCALITAGCRPCQIARLLNLTPSYISKLRTQMRVPAVSHSSRLGPA